MEELKNEIERANQVLGLSQQLPPDLHRPFIDELVLVSHDGREKLFREKDLIDVWFDSGAMPYAQIHYPFSGEQLSGSNFPADFIAEGVDQTRGWFYTLHAIAGLVFDSVAFKTVVSNGLVLDKNGEKMSKRKGNVVDPFETLQKYGADATRWYMISNADPWENLRFDLEGITEVRNKFFGTLFNTYSFFAMYANVDQLDLSLMEPLPISKRPELDRWIVSRLNSLIREYKKYMDDYEPTQAVRLVDRFVNDDLSNWHVRLSRRRFWKTDSSLEKQSAFVTLYECLMACSKLIAPVAPFFAEWLYQSLTGKSTHSLESVHLNLLEEPDFSKIDEALERRMDYAQRISSLVLSLRKAEKIRVRQPLQKILIPILDEGLQKDIEQVAELILAEVNIKQIEYISGDTGIIQKKAKPNFRILGKKLGKLMQAGAAIISDFGNEQISELEKLGKVNIIIEGQSFDILPEEVEIYSEDIPGWLVSTDGDLTVALDIQISEELLAEGTARELINRIQNIRKTKDFNITDRIEVFIEAHPSLESAMQRHRDLISHEILADTLAFSDRNYREKIEMADDLSLGIEVNRI